MKKIVVACGSGVVTSSAVVAKVAELLDDCGYAGGYEFVRCTIAQAVEECADADMLIATTVAPRGITCAYISGIPFLTGCGVKDAQKSILDIMARA